MPKIKVSISTREILKDGMADETMPMALDFQTQSNKTSHRKILESLGFSNIEHIGQGQMGKVYKGTWDSRDGVERAIKIVQKHVAVKELNNYRIVSNARKADKHIAKHFPDVDFVGTHPKTGEGVVVMELLEDNPNAKSIIKDIFGGPEVKVKSHIAMADMDAHKDLSKRSLAMLADLDAKKKLITWVSFGLPRGLSSGVVKQKLMAANFHTMTKVNENWKEAAWRLAAKYSGARDGYGRLAGNWPLDIIEEDLHNAPAILNFVYYYILAAEEQRQAAPEKIHDPNMFGEDLGRSLKDLVLTIRKWSAVGISPSSRDTDLHGAPKGAQAYPGAQSILTALEKLKEITGLTAKDMHDQNVMSRYGTNELVIMDVGLFEREGRVDEMYSTAGQTDYQLQPRVSAEKEHDGHVKKSKHQGLKNVMETKPKKKVYCKINKKG